MNVYNEIAANKAKTYFIASIFFVFAAVTLFIISKALGYSGPSIFIFAFVLSFATSIGGYFFSDKLVLTMHGAHEADRETYFDAYTVTENLAIASGLPKPRLYVIEDPSPNAFATGRNYKNAVVVVTTGILSRLDRRELEGVIAHELSHIKNYDMLLMTVVSIFVGSIAFITDFFMRSLWFRKGDREEKGSGIFMIVGILVAIMAPVVATLMQLAISRRREFLADASGAYLTRYPEGLARALEKIASDPRPMQSASNATAHLFIESPFKADVKGQTSWMLNLFSTHPPIEERIAKLRAM
ncbi:MAG: M48 family metallopeptidase [Patescibacteria group bacterium]